MPAGRLRIDVPVSLERLQILPVVQDYLRHWPMVDVRISFNDRHVDLIEEGIDAAVHVGGLSDSGLVSLTAAPHRLVTYATPDYLRRRGVPAIADDLAGYNCLAFEHSGRTAQWHFQIDGVQRRIQIDENSISIQAEALHDATTAGLGIGQLAIFLISDELRTGRLVPVLERHAAEGLYAPDSNPITDLLAMEGMAAIGRALPLLTTDIRDDNARTEALYGAWLCGTVLGSVGMSLHHKLCHTLDGSFKLPHAETHTIVLPRVLADNAASAPRAMDRIAGALGARDAAAAVHRLALDHGAPTALEAIGMREQDLDRVCDIALQNRYANPQPVEVRALRAAAGRL